MTFSSRYFYAVFLLICGFLAISNAQVTKEKKPFTVSALQAGQAYSNQSNPGFDQNFELYARLAEKASQQDRPDLILFPEYTISGWPYPNESEINSLAETIPGEGQWYQKYAQLAKQLETALLGWMLEVENGKRYNCAVLWDEKGEFVGKYRKVHTNLGEQTGWGWSQGNSLEPLNYNGIKIGVSICSDMWYPETIRAEALNGADIILHQSIANDMDHIAPTRAFDSHVPIIMSIFQGGNYAVDHLGKIVKRLDDQQPAWLTQTFDLNQREIWDKYHGKWDVKAGRLNVRNMEAYGSLVDPTTRPEWTSVFYDNTGKEQSKEQLMERFSGRYDVRDPALYHSELVTFDAPWTSPFRVDKGHPHHLMNNEGEHVFILNKTAWAYFGCGDPVGFLKKAKQQGVNVIRACLEGIPYYDHLGIDLWPWGGNRETPDWHSFNESYWEEVERRIRLAGEHGIGFDLNIYFSLHLTNEQSDVQRKYWSEILSRFGKYANILTWEIQNEYIKNEAFQDQAGTYFKENDPYHRPVITSDGTTENAVWPTKSWMDMAIVHTCTGSVPEYPLSSWYQAIAKNVRQYGKPAFNNESGRENRHKNDDPVHRRKQSWIFNCEGVFWTYHSWEGCEGINDLTYEGPGQQYLLAVKTFFESVPFWELYPDNTVLMTDRNDIIRSSLSDPNRNTTIAYLCTQETGKTIPASNIKLRLPDGQYVIDFVDPVSLNRISSEQVTSSNLRYTTSIKAPGFTDDILIHIRKISAHERTLILGTE